MSSDLPEFTTTHLVIRVPNVNDAEKLRDYYLHNRGHLLRWEPLRSTSFYSLPWWQLRTEQINREFLDASSVSFVAFTPDQQTVVAVANFSNIIQGVFKSCYLGYSIAEEYQGQGLMVEFLQACLSFIFENMGLHRVMANYIPVNQRSGLLLNRLGFEREGYAKKYLKIAGTWQDHVLTALLKEDWQRSGISRQNHKQL